MQQGNDGMSNGPPPPQGYQNVQQMMAPRYAQQPGGGAPQFPGPFPQAPNIPSPPGGPPNTQQQQQQQQQQQHMMQLQMQRHQLQYQQMQQMQQMQQHNPQQYQQQQQQQRPQRHPNQQQNLQQQPSPQQQQKQPQIQAVKNPTLNNGNNSNSNGGNRGTQATPSPRSRPAPFAPPLYQPPSMSSSTTIAAPNVRKGQLASKTRPQPPPHSSSTSSLLASSTPTLPTHNTSTNSAAASSAMVAPVAAPPAPPASNPSAPKKDSAVQKAYISSLAHNTPSEATILAHVQQTESLTKCDWKDKTIWATRQILGGNSINGFLRATATAQRIKKQRARQLAMTKKTLATGGAAVIADDDSKNDSKLNKNAPFDAVAEEQLKKDIMNPRTAKKIKQELEAGLQFCATLHNIVRGILFEVDPAQAPYLPAYIKLDHELVPTPAMVAASGGGGGHVPSTTSSAITAAGAAPFAAMPKPPPLGIQTPTISSIGPGMMPPALTPSGAARISGMSSSSGLLPPAPMPPGQQPQQVLPQLPRPIQQRPSLPGPSSSATGPGHPNQTSLTTASPGNASGSTLRRNRKKKIPQSPAAPIHSSEFDESGKRSFSKKDHMYRVFEVLRFRPLQHGDFVAARVTSRDLWILARVLKDFPGVNMGPTEFLLLTDARRDGMFREKVLVKDVEDKDQNGSTAVARSLVLPLPRTYSEAAEWGVRCKKGHRVYAMYPQTTSLYSATVVDSTTYCRDDDDIIVVDFDGEEPDPVTGQTPTYHIPARFVTLIPRSFPAAQPNTAPKSIAKRKSAPGSLPSMDGGGFGPPGSGPGSVGNKRGRQMSIPSIMPTNSDDALNDMLSEMEDFPTTGGPLDNFDQLDLDFDQPTRSR